MEEDVVILNGWISEERKEIYIALRAVLSGTVLQKIKLIPRVMGYYVLCLVWCFHFKLYIYIYDASFLSYIYMMLHF